SGLVIGRINHPGLRTLYPPVAQGAFALAHLLEPFSLRAWRAVILILDCVSLLLLLALLREAGRSPLWAALYWWHPLLLKEMFNSAHMEAVVIPFLLAGLLLAARGRLLFANLTLSIAAGAKIWPALLLPLVWRKLAMRPRDLAAALACTAAIGLLCAWPLVSAGLDETSGLLAYAARWKTNSALYPLLESGASALLAASGISSLSPSLLARSLIALAICAVALFQARSAFSTLDDLITRALVITACVFLLSPAQFPWYYLWVLPLLALRPVPGLLLAGATLPLYYSAFHFLAHGSYTDFTRYVVWIIWLPVWGVLLRDIAGNGRQAAIGAREGAAAGARREER
ncbi:MAG: DUF2029 domain-containing protein, partial [Alphaproteobacteria bacterium]